MEEVLFVMLPSSHSAGFPLSVMTALKIEVEFEQTEAWTELEELCGVCMNSSTAALSSSSSGSETTERHQFGGFTGNCTS